jgi:hypothetical protein
MRPHGYKFSRREIARHKCRDCGINVIEADDYCMLRAEIWYRKLGLRRSPSWRAGSRCRARGRSVASPSMPVGQGGYSTETSMSCNGTRSSC